MDKKYPCKSIKGKKQMKHDYRKAAMQSHNSRWERDVSDSIFPKAKKKDQLDNWIAKSPSEWPRTHVKVTECDY